jgi:hypothetical protein
VRRLRRRVYRPRSITKKLLGIREHAQTILDGTNAMERFLTDRPDFMADLKTFLKLMSAAHIYPGDLI